MKLTKSRSRQRIKQRVRKKIKGTPMRPRLSVYRSNKAIYCQLIDDINGATIAAASSKDLGDAKGKNKVDQAKEVGKLIADRIGTATYEKIVFDRSGYLYHGRVKALAEGAREAGLNL